MRVRGLCVAASLLFTSLASARDKSVLDFPGLGPVSIQALRVKGRVPYVDFVARDGKQLLRVEPETDKFWEVYDVQDATGPHIYYGLLHVAGLPGPLVFVADRYVYADDCGMTPVLAAVWDGNLRVLTPKLLEFWTRGGAYLKPGSNGKPARLTIVAERYQEHDAHFSGPSKMAVYEYDFDTTTGKFVLLRHKEIPADDVKVAGKSLLPAIPELGTC